MSYWCSRRTNEHGRLSMPIIPEFSYPGKFGSNNFLRRSRKKFSTRNSGGNANIISLSTISKLPSHLSIHLSFLDRLAFVMLLLTTHDGDRNLDEIGFIIY